MGKGPRLPRPSWLWTFGCRHAHRTVAVVYAHMFGGRFGPGDRIVALHLRSVATRASDVRGRIAKARVAVEAAPGSQTDEYLARAPLQRSLQFHRVVARVEDEQGHRNFSSFEPTQQSPHLRGGDHVGVLGGPDTLHVHRGGPALADEAQLCDELVGPSGDDGLAGGVAGRMVVEAALGARLGVAARPHARVHGKDRHLPFGAGERMAG